MDGGVLENVPLKSVIKKGATRIFMILNYPNDKDTRIMPKKDVSGIFGIVARTIELMSNEGYWEDLAICELMNSHPDMKKIELHVVAPDRQILTAMDFDHALIQKAISQGYLDSKRMLEAMSKQNH